MRVVIAAVLALLCSAASAHAQLAGELGGSIYDPTGAPLPGVRVALRGMTDRETQTSAAGDSHFKIFPRVTTRFPHGGAINLISRPPTNDFQAAAEVTAGNFDAVRATARIGGPLKRDRVMGNVAFARSVRRGYVRDLEHPDNPLGGDDVLTARGQLRVVFDRRTSLLLSSDVDHQDGTPLTYNKVLVVKPGFHVDNPSDFHDVRSSAVTWNRTRHSGASARLTTAITPSTTLVSLTAFRRLDREFVVDSDSTELDVLTTHQDERQHQLSEEITISHQEPGLTWVGGVFSSMKTTTRRSTSISQRSEPRFSSILASTRSAGRSSDRQPSD